MALNLLMENSVQQDYLLLLYHLLLYPTSYQKTANLSGFDKSELDLPHFTKEMRVGILPDFKKIEDKFSPSPPPSPLKNKEVMRE